MRVIIYGAGAVGSAIGGRLRQGGADVVLVARQAHATAIRDNGLALRTAKGTDMIAVDAVSAIDQLDPTGDDVVIITAKTQDTPAIHAALFDWNADVPVVCGTNGVEHERLALRRFARVYGMVVQLPAQFERPGEVTVLCAPTNAILDVGRYPSGVDETAVELSRLVDAAPCLLSEADDDVMTKKYGKLLVNLGNAADAACGLAGRGGASLRLQSTRAGVCIKLRASVGSRRPSASSVTSRARRRCSSTSRLVTPLSAGRRGRA